MNRPLYVRGTMVEDGQVRDLVIVDGVVADATPLPAREPDAAGWVLPGLADVHNHLSLASPAGDHEEPAVRVRASASVELAVGVLAIREPGSPDDAARLGRRLGDPRHAAWLEEALATAQRCGMRALTSQLQHPEASDLGLYPWLPPEQQVGHSAGAGHGVEMETVQ